MSFSVHATPRFDRLLKALARHHPELPGIYEQALVILRADPYNLSRKYNIKKLGVASGEGQYRLRIRRWRFRYDIFVQEVWLFYCGFRREETYK